MIKMNMKTSNFLLYGCLAVVGAFFTACVFCGCQEVEVAPTTTADYEAGVYKYQARVTKDAESYVVETGKIKVRPNFATQKTGYDDRSDTKQIFDAIDAVLKNKASQDQQSVSIGGRALSRFSWSELIEARKYFKAQYLAEERDAGRRPKTVGVAL